MTGAATAERLPAGLAEHFDRRDQRLGEGRDVLRRLRLVMILPSRTTRSSDTSAPALREIGADRRPAGDLSPAQHVGLDQQPRPVADRRHRLARRGEGPHQRDRVAARCAAHRD